ncbi:glycine cleavage system aminomethyltransferase GcvT [Naasia lichenicola]|uniref:Aminomethyltransferase n=1 Tax=Naasia lichenicola TaxID=2565933 RepID=A0A4S4FG98_9MICO|nr:glycine cleavage system aminomethyltransferase GcvT [Naasia lichenicola]THG28782.1 glycine cleavage system aminomethyltransferase GcvT [Naasia lichenicola]
MPEDATPNGGAPEDAAPRFSPLHDRHVALGATFTDFAGWQMPVRYSSDLAEHHAVRAAAGLFDLSHMGEILVVGVQAANALDYALSGRMSALADRQAKYTLMLDDDGGIVDDLIVYRNGPDRYLVVANASNREAVAEALRVRAEDFDAVVEDESDDIGLIAIQGPKSLEILAELEGLDLHASAPEAASPGEALEALNYYRSIPGEYLGRRILVARTGYTGEDGFELYTSPEALPALWDALLETGAGSGLVPAGLASRDTLRLEAGMPLYGHELSAAIQPGQAGLGRTVTMDKPSDFVGRGALEAEAVIALEHGRADDYRVLVGIEATGRRAARAGYPIHATASGDDVVGEVTSGALSPTLGHPIAMAFVSPGWSAPGTPLFLDVRGTRIPATIVALPFYQRKAQ